jgi:hypothetical protein
MENLTVGQSIVFGFLALYILYGIGGIGITGLLFSFAIGLIVNSYTDNLELTVAGVILSGLLWKTIVDRRRRSEGFEAGKPGLAYPANVPLGAGQSGIDITRKVEEITRKNVFQPSGVLSSCFVEGFANAGTTDAALPDAGDKKAKPAGEGTPPPAESTAAPANAPTVTSTLTKDLPAATAAAAATPPAQPNAEERAGFADPSTAGMFKLGSIPTEVIGGAHIDVGTTLMNAMNALKPDQIKAMTEDTRKLLETQKSLMGMLGTMKPMLQDGKQLMETFGTMFGK